MSSLEKQPESEQTAPRHWRSLAELANAPEYRAFLEAEFPAEADPSGISRRRWLQVMGASLAFAGVGGGCRWEEAAIVPMVRRPANRVPGEPQWFATAMDLRGAALGLLVNSVDGRPIKIEGNPQHPQSLGATDALAQASLLQLYDPDRSGNLLRGTAQGEVIQTWQDFAEFAQKHFGELRQAGGKGFRVLAETSSSPTLAALRDRLREAFPQAKWYEYEPLSRDNERDGTKLAFGKVYRPYYHLDQAKVIVAIDEDLLCHHPAGVRYARAFAEGREVVNGRMNRLYAVESCYTPTGAAADHRLPMRAQDIGRFVAALERKVGELADGGGHASHAAAGELESFVLALAKDLVVHRGESVVAVGPRQPAEVQAAAHRINAALGNIGKSVVYFAEPDADRLSHREAIVALVGEMQADQVDTLLVLGGNPVYNAPVDLDFAEAMAKVKTKIHFGLYPDETARAADWHLPQAHYLESWGDARSWDGTYSVVQPLIDPLLGGKSAIELLALILGEEKSSGLDLVQATFEGIAGKEDPGLLWRKTVHDGLLEGSGWSPEAPSLAGTAGPESAGGLAELGWKGGPLEIVFYGDPSVYDGRFANNAWLQETPDPITKLTWDNAALIGPATAAALGVEDHAMVRLEVGGRELVMPVYVLPGQAPGSVAVGLGYGRGAAGFVGGDDRRGIRPVGFNTYRLRQSNALEFATGAALEPTGETYPLASTQDHHAIDTVGMKARAHRVGELIRQASLEYYLEHPEFARHMVHHPPLKSLWEEPEFAEGHRWGMSIDLSKCIGCNACVVACQAENNVPIVGKEQVARGREMHWIRIDRYFSGDPERPLVDNQVMLCQHCEMAPCEQVCPVAATLHSSEGLNDMVYNRCVGTRYCSNNCPYKVRRFNFFNYHKNLDSPGNELTKMVYNPEVTVRSRGVMEKCTYCVQRIQNTKIEAKNNRRPIRDGEIQTACQQACPSQAIVFGDLADKTSRVFKNHTADRAYGVLAELNTQPRTAYLAKIRNPNPELEAAPHDDDHHSA